jgi:acetyl-CoA carboxylase biotin carboxylase subunit
LGDKIISKKTMSDVGIPVIPGSGGAVADESEAQIMAKKIGFPVLIKAAGGGGGKGMRVVREMRELASALKQAISEAQSAFGNPTVFIEKFLEAPRHIEFQILADNHGNVIHLFERECSVQRRHQKLIEESPSAIMNPDLRAKMGQAAVQAVKTAKYTNAGTVEFMVDKNRNFYFLEMNTRLQVEHPVTELITGIDIVKEQFKIAAGHGRIVEIVEPGGPGIRLDSGVYEGFEVPIYYDPLIAKLLIWAPSREEAISRAKRALKEYTIRGIKTSIPFHILVMNTPEFVKGEYDTTFIDEVLGKVVYKKEYHEVAAIAVAIGKIIKEKRVVVGKPSGRRSSSSWKMYGRKAMMRSN